MRFQTPSPQGHESIPSTNFIAQSLKHVGVSQAALHKASSSSSIFSHHVKFQFDPGSAQVPSSG